MKKKSSKKKANNRFRRLFPCESPFCSSFAKKPDSKGFFEVFSLKKESDSNGLLFICLFFLRFVSCKRLEKTMRNNLRSSGVFLPIFSLPGDYGIGTLSKGAFQFIDFLSDAGFAYWVVLPLTPTGFANSPFQSFSSRALNHYFIDFDDLVEKGLLKKQDFEEISWGDDPRKVDYSKIYKNKTDVLKIAYRRFKKGNGDYQRGYTTFLRKNRFFDYACFMVLKEKNQGKPWNEFDNDFREYSFENFMKVRHKYKDDVEFYLWTQYIFLRQWHTLLAYAHKKGVKIIGDMPMHVSYDSIDVYKHHRNFVLTNLDEMKYVAGYPPDVFYDKGQVWGTPLYDFDYLKRNDYRLFKDRLDFAYDLFDLVILDHFRGYLENYYLPKGSKDGLMGRWEKEDGMKVVDSFVSDKSRVIAENVDFHSEDMKKILSTLQIKDERVIEFGYPQELGNINQPISYNYSTISFSSTHDCKPLKAYLESLSETSRKLTLYQINKDCRHFGVKEVDSLDADKEVEALLELNLASLSSIAIQSMNDLLFMGKEGRINTPSTIEDNWTFRITKEDLSSTNAKHLLGLNKRYGRY